MIASRLAVVMVAAAALGVGLLAGAGKGRAETTKIATVDVVELLQDMLQTPQYAGPRDANRNTSVAELAEMEDEMRRIDTELRMLTPADQARGQRLYSDLQQRQANYRDAAQRRSAEFQALSGQQAAEVYAKIHEAATAVAMAAGYTHVLASRDGAAIEDTDSLPAVIQGLLARPAMLFPAADDLTGKVRERLAIPVSQAPGQSEPGAAEGNEGQPDQP